VTSCPDLMKISCRPAPRKKYLSIKFRGGGSPSSWVEKPNLHMRKKNGGGGFFSRCRSANEERLCPLDRPTKKNGGGGGGTTEGNTTGTLKDNPAPNRSGNGGSRTKEKSATTSWSRGRFEQGKRSSAAIELLVERRKPGSWGFSSKRGEFRRRGKKKLHALHNSTPETTCQKRNETRKFRR